MDDEDGFADPPTEWTGSDRGDKRGWGCLVMLAVSVAVFMGLRLLVSWI
jgi:hypothetical protein